jgi:hypothetical protein
LEKRSSHNRAIGKEKKMKTRITDWRAYTFQPKHPERTVFKNAPGLGVDITFWEFKTVEAMENFINKQDSRPQWGETWRPIRKGSGNWKKIIEEVKA